MSYKKIILSIFSLLMLGLTSNSFGSDDLSDINIDDSTTLRFNVKRTLADLREKLGGDMLVDTRFRTKDGKEILPSSEEDYKVEDILKDNTLKLKKVSQGIVRELTNVVNPYKGLGDGSESCPELSLNKGVKKEFSDVQGIASYNAQEIETMHRYEKLTDEDKKKLFNGLHLSRGITFLGSQENILVELSNFDCLDINIKNLTYTKPTESFKSYASFCYKESEGIYKALGTTDVGADLDILNLFFNLKGASQGHADISSSNSDYQLSVTTYACTEIIKVIFGLDINTLTLKEDVESDFQNAIALGNENKKNDAYNRILAVLKRYGLFIPTRFVVGGGIYAEKDKQVQSTVEAMREAQKFGVAFTSSFNAFNSIEGGVDAHGARFNKKEETENYIEQVETNSKRVKAGHQRFYKDIGDFNKSLYSFENWVVLKKDDLYPIINFLQEDLQREVFKLIQENAEKKHDSYPWNMSYYLKKVKDAQSYFISKKSIGKQLSPKSPEKDERGPNTSDVWHQISLTQHQTKNLMTPVIFRNHIYLAHLGENSNKVYFLKSSDGKVWSKHENLSSEFMTDYPVALKTFNEKLHMFRMDKQINNAIIQHYSCHGEKWNDVWSFVPEKKSYSRVYPAIYSKVYPALEVFKGKIYIVYIANVSGWKFYIASYSPEGQIWSDPKIVRKDWKTKKPVAIKTFKKRLYMAHGSSHDQAVYFSSSEDGQTWLNAEKVKVQEHDESVEIKTEYPVSLNTFNEYLYMGFIDSKAKTKKISYIFTENGENWYGIQRVFPHLNISHPFSMIFFKNKHLIFYRLNNNNNIHIAYHENPEAILKAVCEKKSQKTKPGK